jgi:hypothetical protein
MSQSLDFPISPIIRELVWDPLTPPYYSELISQGANKEEIREKREDDPNFLRLLRFRIVLISQLDLEDPSDLGLGRSYEGLESHDVYQMSLKAPSYAIAKDYYEKFRDLLINYPKLKNNPSFKPYNRFEIEPLTPIRLKARFIYEFKILAFKAGKVRRHS